MDESGNTLYPQFAVSPLATALEDTPVVLVTGPRRCGKTTATIKAMTKGVAEKLAGVKEVTVYAQEIVLEPKHAWRRPEAEGDVQVM